MTTDAIVQQLFTATDASRLTHVGAASARRWVAGYAYDYKGERRATPARLGQHSGEIEGILLMSFLDLIEVQMATNLRRKHISWKRVRETAAFFREKWNSDHPFALQRFRSDGKIVFAELGAASGDRQAIEMGTNQYVFDALIEQSLFDVLDFRDDGFPWRLWPRGRGTPIVVDPARAFGRPIIADSGIPVRTIVLAYAANDNQVGRVARWLEISPEAVEAALRFEAALSVAA